MRTDVYALPNHTLETADAPPNMSLEPRESTGIFVPGSPPGPPADAVRAGFVVVGDFRGNPPYHSFVLGAQLPAKSAPQRTPRKERGTFGGTFGGTSQLPAVRPLAVLE